jgi:hypothetical protein
MSFPTRESYQQKENHTNRKAILSLFRKYTRGIALQYSPYSESKLHEQMLIKSLSLSKSSTGIHKIFRALFSITKKQKRNQLITYWMSPDEALISKNFKSFKILFFIKLFETSRTLVTRNGLSI